MKRLVFKDNCLTCSAATIVLLSLCVSQGVEAQSWTGPHERDSWYIGFGVGSGDGGYTVGDTDVRYSDVTTGSDSDGTFGLEFKVGYTLRPNILIGLDLSSLGTTGTFENRDVIFGGDLRVGYSQSSYFLTTTFFPLDEGVFVRAGGGLARGVTSLHRERFLDTAEDLGTDTVIGYGGMAGIGYELWLGETFNLSVNLDYHVHQYVGDAGEPDGGSFYLAYLGFGWY